MPPRATPNPRAEPALAAAERAAVIDIGSNSIRLVVFDRVCRSPLPLFNEKVLCGLGRGLDATGQLHEAGVGLARDNLVRFVRLAEAMGVGRLDLLATAAVRDASNGRDFVAEVERECGTRVHVLSGEDEARLSALGVVSGIPGADGLMGDLGGGSLELVALDGGRLGQHATLPLGPLRLMESGGGDREEARTRIDEQLATVAWLGDLKGRSFYPVGGAWRTLARIQMEQAGYPLHVIQQYRVDRRHAEDLARVIGRLGRRSLASIAGMSRRRLDTLPFAALLLERLLRLTKPAAIEFSAFGLREGHLFSRLPAAEQQKDPLLAAAAEFGEAAHRFGPLGLLLHDWTAPLFRKESSDARRLRLAVCHLSDIAWRDHPDYRAREACTRILHLPVSGIEHPERVSAALALAMRYGGDVDMPELRGVRRMLDEAQEQDAIVLGLALRLAYSLSGATASLLRRTGVRLDGKTLALVLPEGGRVMLGEAVQRRLEALGRALDCRTETAESARPN